MLDSITIALLAFGTACYMLSSALDDINNALENHNKKMEKKKKENIERRKRQEIETKERRAMIAARFEARAKAQAEEKHTDSELNK